MRSVIAIIASVLMVSIAQAKPASPAPSLARGEAVYQKWCATCHADGKNYAGTMALRAKYKGAIEPVLARRADLDAASIQFFVRNGISVMPFFRKTEVSDEDLAALSAYLTRHGKK